MHDEQSSTETRTDGKGKTENPDTGAAGAAPGANGKGQGESVDFKKSRRGKRDIELTGMKFGRLSVLNVETTGKSKGKTWKCLCACGAIKSLPTSSLTKGNTKSCGCLHRDLAHQNFLTHGGAKTRLYKIWSNMRTRCFSEKHEAYENYGGRGITICAEWDDFERFKADMGEPPSPKHTLDRENNDGNYEPNNCRWSTWTEQQNNRGNNHVLELNGKRHTIAEWARISGVKRGTIGFRIRSGWKPERAVNQPPRK